MKTIQEINEELVEKCGDLFYESNGEYRVGIYGDEICSESVKKIQDYYAAQFSLLVGEIIDIKIPKYNHQKSVSGKHIFKGCDGCYRKEALLRTKAEIRARIKAAGLEVKGN